MRAATNAILAVVATAASLSGCKKAEAPPPDQNITVDNGVDPGADIEAVPADEGGPSDDNASDASINDASANGAAASN
jgi:hypothetical protein